MALPAIPAQGLALDARALDGLRRDASADPRAALRQAAGQFEATADELEAALQGAAGIFERLHREMEENNLATFRPGPWNAGLVPFPPVPGAGRRA